MNFMMLIKWHLRSYLKTTACNESANSLENRKFESIEWKKLMEDIYLLYNFVTENKKKVPRINEWFHIIW